MQTPGQEISECDIPNSHKLQHSWTIYDQKKFQDNKNVKQGYFNSFTPICTFSTVELFWLNWAKIPDLTGAFYDGHSMKEIICIEKDEGRSIERRFYLEGQAIFKSGIKPESEDPHNSPGFSANFTFSESSYNNLTQVWEKTVLAMIGQTLDPSDKITGARFIEKNMSSKKGNSCTYRLEIWIGEKIDADDIKQKIVGICKSCNINKADICYHERDLSKAY